MSREQLQKDILKKLHGMNHFARLVAAKREEKDIHRFRVNYKKLRALLRMVHPDGHKAGLPKTLKQLYAAAGVMRDLQLHQNTLKAYFAQYDTVPDGYLEHISKATAEAGHDFDKLYKQCSFSRMSRIIKTHIPHKYHKKLKHWQDDNTQALIAASTPGMTDDAIHEIRKHLKDLAYTQKYLQLEKDYNPFAKTIGDYIDSYTQLQLLEEHMGHAPADELPMLEHARHRWQTQKNVLKQVTLNDISRLP